MSIERKFDMALGETRLLMMGSQMRFGRNAEIYGEGEPAEYLYKVMSGAVRVSKLLDDGRRQVTAFHLPGEIFGLELGKEHRFSAEAISESSILVVKRSAVRVGTDGRPITDESNVVAFYPSPAGATESIPSPAAWEEIVRQNPVLNEVRPDVEALLANRLEHTRPEGGEYYVVPIDKCYELVGLIRIHWRGLSGGTEVWNDIARFFTELKTRASWERANA